ncbi:MAG: hypothetical protein M3461_14285, partial [Pseudomonadota bacterium]|nr:hypothetical protein [Pseudomonadota bacterium]
MRLISLHELRPLVIHAVLLLAGAGCSTPPSQPTTPTMPQPQSQSTQSVSPSSPKSSSQTSSRSQSGAQSPATTAGQTPQAAPSAGDTSQSSASDNRSNAGSQSATGADAGRQQAGEGTVQSGAQTEDQVLDAALETFDKDMQGAAKTAGGEPGVQEKATAESGSPPPLGAPADIGPSPAGSAAGGAAHAG